MSVRFLVNFPSTDEAGVREYETLIGHSLPTDFREFLLKTNGGKKPKPEGFRVETGETSMVSVFYPIGKRGTFHDLGGQFLTMRNELPEGVIPIGQDIGGNTLCLAVAGEDAGAVLFMDHEVETGPHKDGWDNLYFCARSFSEFLENLRD
jgi:hypothetical protein